MEVVVQLVGRYAVADDIALRTLRRLPRQAHAAAVGGIALHRKAVGGLRPAATASSENAQVAQREVLRDGIGHILQLYIPRLERLLELDVVVRRIAALAAAVGHGVPRLAVDRRIYDIALVKAPDDTLVRGAVLVEVDLYGANRRERPKVDLEPLAVAVRGGHPCRAGILVDSPVGRITGDKTKCIDSD